MQAWAYGFTYLFVCAVTCIRAAISYLCLFGCTSCLVCLAILDQISPDTELLSEHQLISGIPLISECIDSLAKPVFSICEHFL